MISEVYIGDSLHYYITPTERTEEEFEQRRLLFIFWFCVIATSSDKHSSCASAIIRWKFFLRYVFIGLLGFILDYDDVWTRIFDVLILYTTYVRQIIGGSLLVVG